MRTIICKLPNISSLILLGLAASAALAVGCGSDDDSSGNQAGAGTRAGNTGYSGGAGSSGKANAEGGTPEQETQAGAGSEIGGAVQGGSGGTSAGSGSGGANAGSGSIPHQAAGSGGDAGELGDVAGSAGALGSAGDAGGPAAPTSYTVKRTNLTSDQDGVALHTDPHLVNAWSIAVNPSAQVFWLSSNHGGSTPVYGADGSVRTTDPTVPAFAVGETGSPTGQMFNAGTNFKNDKFIVDTEDGQVLGWAPPAATFTMRAHSTTAIYKGLALVGSGATQQLLAANFHDARIDIFDADYAPVAKPAAFKDASIPAGYAPFNVVAVGERVFVAYAKQDSDAEDDVSGEGHGFVSVFAADGTLQKSWLKRGALNSPWAISPAPTGFGVPASALLVGNFGDGRIGAYDQDSGELIGQLTNAAGVPIAIDGLWDLKVGPEGAAGLSAMLFFSAGPDAEDHGLFGKLEAATP